MFSVCMCAKYQLSPKESHFNIVIRILRYLNKTSQYDVWFHKCSACCVVGYYDSNLAWCLSDRTNISSTCHLFWNCLVSWNYKKQHSVSLSTVETEYVVVGIYYAQVAWIKQQLLDYDSKLGCISIKCDNTSAVNLSKNPVLHSRTKHIEIWHHFLRYHVENGGHCFWIRWYKKNNLLTFYKTIIIITFSQYLQGIGNPGFLMF